MNILITYFTQTGNTEKIAKAIYEEVLSQGNETHLKHIGEISTSEFNDYDLIFLGSACHDADLAQPAKRILDEISHSAPFSLAGFFTHAVYMPGGEDARQGMFEQWAGKCIQSFEQVCQEKGITWCGYFSCPGRPSPPIEEFIHREIVTDDEEWERYIANVRKYPNDDDLNKAKGFACSMLKKLETTTP